jgi:hypothetical protein
MIRGELTMYTWMAGAASGVPASWKTRSANVERLSGTLLRRTLNGTRSIVLSMKLRRRFGCYGVSSFTYV